MVFMMTLSLAQRLDKFQGKGLSHQKKSTRPLQSPVPTDLLGLRSAYHFIHLGGVIQ